MLKRIWKIPFISIKQTKRVMEAAEEAGHSINSNALRLSGCNHPRSLMIVIATLTEASFNRTGGEMACDEV
jgi:hypothetical protein